MTQTLLFILVVAVGLFYVFKHKKHAQEKVAKFENSKKQHQPIIQEKIVLKYFGEIDLHHTKEYMDVVAHINGNKISIDLNIVEEVISREKIQPSFNFLENLDKIEKIAHQQIITDFENGNWVKEYINHHLEEFSEDELNSLGIDLRESEEQKKLKLLNKIHLKRIGIYPEQWESLAIFDYTINDDLTQYLIVLSFDSNGNFVAIYLES